MWRRSERMRQRCRRFQPKRHQSVQQSCNIGSDKIPSSVMARARSGVEEAHWRGNFARAETFHCEVRRCQLRGGGGFFKKKRGKGEGERAGWSPGGGGFPPAVWGGEGGGGP